MDMKVTTTVTIEIGGEKHVLSAADARRLRDALNAAPNEASLGAPMPSLLGAPGRPLLSWPAGTPSVPRVGEMWLAGGGCQQ